MKTRHQVSQHKKPPFLDILKRVVCRDDVDLQRTGMHNTMIFLSETKKRKEKRKGEWRPGCYFFDFDKLPDSRRVARATHDGRVGARVGRFGSDWGRRRRGAALAFGD